MATQSFEIVIDAPRRHVWKNMLQSPGFEEWTQEFCPGSHFEGSWEEGQAIRFLDPDGNGMLSEIAAHRPAEFVSIRHLGMIMHGREDTQSESVRAWAPCYENYSFGDEGGATRLLVEMDVFKGCEEMMAERWPRALQRLKRLCEGKAS